MHGRLDARWRGFSSGNRGWVCSLFRVSAVVAALSSVLAAGGRADTIVLKNGKRIVALSVVEDGDKIRYETAAGELSLPRSIVDHIERGPAGVMPDSPAAEAANLAIAPPAFESDAAVGEGTGHEGLVERK